MEDLSIPGMTRIVVSHGLADEVIPARAGRSRVAILTQAAVIDRAVEISQVLESDGLTCEVIGLPDRDEAKTLETAESVYEDLARLGLTRYDTIVGVGGGAATDLAGYIAGTWLRGIEVVHHPTTLLAAVDASIGGKTGVNLAGKNLVGVFWHPTLVVVDIELLGRLPEVLLIEGMSEVYKSGLVGDPGLCALLERDGLSADLEEVVRRAAAVKLGIVAADEREVGDRAFLNFGHTIGHAVEFASSLSHGESVAVGMVAASRVSERAVGFESAALVSSTLDRLGLPTSADDVDSARVADLLKYDKKRDQDGLRMVLLRDVGDPVLVYVVPDDVTAGLRAVGL